MEAEHLLQMASQAWLIWLTIIFIVIVVWAFWPKNRDRFEHDATIPFRDEENGGQRHGG